MKKNNLIISTGAALVALVAVSGIAMSTFAADNNTNNKEQARPERSLERGVMGMRGGFMGGNEDTIAALEAGDYNAWKESLPENCPLLEKINETNFSKLVEASNLMKQARDIYDELGFNEPGEGMGFQKGDGRGMMGKGIGSGNKGTCPYAEEE